MPLHLVILSNDDMLPALLESARQRGGWAGVHGVSTLESLYTAVEAALPSVFLLSFSTGVIVPADLLEKLNGRAVNIHPASREFPGRDPHHFAAYAGVRRYGATAHLMIGKVDAGGIIEEHVSDVAPDLLPEELLQVAEENGLALFERMLERIADGNIAEEVSLQWQGRKTRRSDFLKLCRISETMPAREIERRRKACSFKDYENLYVELDGVRFELKKSELSAVQEPGRDWNDFTEDAYRGLLGAAKSNGYAFGTYRSPPASKHVLWRHDIDYSLHRAKRLAQIEREEGVVATYFVCLRLPFYNLLEKESVAILRDIAGMGHELGLHFDAGFYDEEWSPARLAECVTAEKVIVEDAVGVGLVAVSFHDPNAGNMLAFDQKKLGGLVNAYSSDLKSDYDYCSDSNGYWRHKPIRDVIEQGGERNLQILTHPGWWLPAPLPPRQRIERAVMGRARSVMAQYDGHLAQSGRDNVE